MIRIPSRLSSLKLTRRHSLSLSTIYGLLKKTNNQKNPVRTMTWSTWQSQECTKRFLDNVRIKEISTKCKIWIRKPLRVFWSRCKPQTSRSCTKDYRVKIRWGGSWELTIIFCSIKSQNRAFLNLNKKMGNSLQQVAQWYYLGIWLKKPWLLQTIAHTGPFLSTLKISKQSPTSASDPPTTQPEKTLSRHHTHTKRPSKRTRETNQFFQ